MMHWIRRARKNLLGGTGLDGGYTILIDPAPMHPHIGQHCGPCCAGGGKTNFKKSTRLRYEFHFGQSKTQCITLIANPLNSDYICKNHIEQLLHSKPLDIFWWEGRAEKSAEAFREQKLVIFPFLSFLMQTVYTFFFIRTLCFCKGSSFLNFLTFEPIFFLYSAVLRPNFLIFFLNFRWSGVVFSKFFE